MGAVSSYLRELRGVSFAESHIEGTAFRGMDQRTTLRDVLRAATADEHRDLDHAMADLVLSRRVDLIRFLQIHLHARLGIEAWLDANCPPGWEPPAQTGLIAHDLTALGAASDRASPASFDPGCDADWIGPAYVIAGSHLGNRLLLAQCGNAPPEDARRFLTGETMQDYWRRLRTLLSEAPGPDGGAAAVRGAHAAFAHFGTCVERHARADFAAA